MATKEDLIKKAKEVAKQHNLSEDVRTGEVGCALETKEGNIYVGVSIHACCGIGFCAEHSAIAAMVTNEEFEIKSIVAVSSEDTVFPPCGRCREMMYEINSKNINADVILSENRTLKLKDLLPEIWQEKAY